MLMREEPKECGHLLDFQNQCPRIEKCMSHLQTLNLNKPNVRAVFPVTLFLIWLPLMFASLKAGKVC